MKKLNKLLLILSVILILTSCSSQTTTEATALALKSGGIQQDQLIVKQLDVGQGDSCIIQMNGESMIIDAGNKDDKKKIMDTSKAMGIKTFKYIVFTHPHADHIGSAADVIRDKSDKNSVIIMPKVTTNTATFRGLVSEIKKKSYSITTPVPGNTYTLGKATFTILGPNSDKYDDLNDYSVVIRLVYGKNSFLFTGDAGGKAEEELLKYDIASDYIKVGHHGSTHSSSDKFLDKATKPTSWAIISCGKNNDYGHPHKATLDRLTKRGLKILRTDLLGDITFISDGTTMTCDKEAK